MFLIKNTLRVLDGVANFNLMKCLLQHVFTTGALVDIRVLCRNSMMLAIFRCGLQKCIVSFLMITIRSSDYSIEVLRT